MNQFGVSGLDIRWTCILAILLVVILVPDSGVARFGMDGGSYVYGFGPQARQAGLDDEDAEERTERLVRRRLERRLMGSAVVPDQISYFFENQSFALCRSICHGWEHCDSYWWDGLQSMCFLDSHIV